MSAIFSGKKLYGHSKAMVRAMKDDRVWYCYGADGKGERIVVNQRGDQLIADDRMPDDEFFYYENNPITVAALQKPLRAAPTSEGRKDDKGKDRFELLPPEPLFAIARVLTFGAKKYADRNWEKGMAWGRPFGAMMRHMWCWWGGAGPTTKSFLLGELDDETGFSHLWHAGCCLFFLIAYEERKVGFDDRPTDTV